MRRVRELSWDCLSELSECHQQRCQATHCPGCAGSGCERSEHEEDSRVRRKGCGRSEHEEDARVRRKRGRAKREKRRKMPVCGGSGPQERSSGRDPPNPPLRPARSHVMQTRRSGHTSSHKRRASAGYLLFPNLAARSQPQPAVQEHERRRPRDRLRVVCHGVQTNLERSTAAP
jgi:hypothetical protein